MEKDYYLKAGEMTGIIKTVRLHKIMAEALEYIRIKEAIDSGIHKAYGRNAKEYCQDICGIPYSTYNEHEAGIRRIGKDLWVMQKLMGWSSADVQALTALPEDSRVKINEKGNTLEVDGKKISLENKTEIQETINAILKREELTIKEKELAVKEAKHEQKKREGVEKECKREVEASNKKIADLTALVVDPKLPDGFDSLFQFVERKTDEIFMAAAKLKFEDAYGDEKTGETGRIRVLYAERLRLIHNRFANCVKRLEDSIGMEVSL